MHFWICIAYDPLPEIDHTTRLLRYGMLAEQLVASGHSVVLWTSTFDHWRKKQRFDRDHTERLKSGLHIELLHAPSYAQNISWSRVRHNRAIARSFLSRAATASRPDVIVAGIPCLELAEAAAVYARANNVPLCIDIQDVWPEVYVTVLPRWLRSFGRIILRREFRRARRILREAAAVTAVSQQYLDWAQRLGGVIGQFDRVFHLGYRMPAKPQLAAAKERFVEFSRRWRLPRDRVFATFLGQFAASYDIDTLVRAARLLEANDSPIHFVIAGAGDKFARTKRAARGLSSVTLTGWLEYEDTITLLQFSHIGLAAYSRGASQSLPYKPFEYMAFGLPIISSLRGELRDLIAQHNLGGWYCAGDARTLAQAVYQLVASPQQRVQAGRNAQELYGRQFEAGLITGRLIQHLEAVALSRR